MKKFTILLMMGMVLFISGCSDDEVEVIDYEYVEFGITMGDNTVFYREYSSADSCSLETAVVLYDRFDDYFYIEPVLSFNDQCSSNLYIIELGEYKEINFASYLGFFFEVALADVDWGVVVYKSKITPDIVTIDLLKMELVYKETEDLINAAKSYCYINTCSDTQRFKFSDLRNSLYYFNEDYYDLYARSGIVIELVDGNWITYLEAAGIGNYEFPQGIIFDGTDYTAVLIDDN
ncbi:MAG: hypothetical protein QM489_05755 [Candidatus Izemoplasma sp.]